MNFLDTIKTCIHQQYKQNITKEHRLQYLFFEITRRCNLNCLHCGSDCKKETNMPELSTQSWIKIADYIKTNFDKKVNIVISGGEPLVHKGVFEIGKAIRDNGMKWGMVTNGMLLTAANMEKLEEAGISSLTISVDGTEASHNKLRNSREAFGKVTKALYVLGGSSLQFKDAVTCVFKENLHQLDQIAELLIANKIYSWRLFRIFDSGRALSISKLLLSFEETKQMVEWIRENKKRYKKRGLSINLSCEGWLPWDVDKKVRDFPFFCRAGVNFASILCDGTITGCTNNHSTFYCGNILSDDFKAAWEQKFNVFRERAWLKDTDCNECNHKKQCNGGSIHLWDLNKKAPNFCYVKNIKKKTLPFTPE